MESTGLVSIAMATYNGERYLRKQLDSVYAQTYKNIEVVVTDDCSSDSTTSILEVYKKTYGLRYSVNKTNLGYYKNFEQVLGLCKGRYIALADQDDIWKPDKIQRLVETIHGYSIAFSDASYIDEDDRIISKSVKAYSLLPIVSGKPFKTLVFNGFVIGCTALFKKELLETALPFPEGEKYHDWWLSLVACTSAGIIFLDEQLVLYRKHSANALGIEKYSGLFGKMFGFLLKQPDRSLFQIQEKRLSYLSKNDIFNEEEKRYLQTAHEYYHDRLGAGLHRKAFKIAFTNRKFVFPSYKGFWRIKAVAGTLLR